MQSRYSSSSGIARLVSVFAAMVLTVTLFGAVALGLTGEIEGSILAGSPAAVPAAAQA
jgi:hypothetical protein